MRTSTLAMNVSSCYIDENIQREFLLPFLALFMFQRAFTLAILAEKVGFKQIISLIQYFLFKSFLFKVEI